MSSPSNRLLLSFLILKKFSIMFIISVFPNLRTLYYNNTNKILPQSSQKYNNNCYKNRSGCIYKILQLHLFNSLEFNTNCRNKPWIIRIIMYISILLNSVIMKMDLPFSPALNNFKNLIHLTLKVTTKAMNKSI